MIQKKYDSLKVKEREGKLSGHNIFLEEPQGVRKEEAEVPGLWRCRSGGRGDNGSGTRSNDGSGDVEDVGVGEDESRGEDGGRARVDDGL